MSITEDILLDNNLNPNPTNGGDPINHLEGWNKNQKLAGLLVVLGSEVASTILNQFDEREVEEIMKEMAKLDFISIPVQQAIVKEFSGITIAAVTSTAGGPAYARTILEKSLGSLKANEILTRVSPSKFRSLEAGVLREVQPRQLMSLLRKEQTQTWALVLSYLEPTRCAEVLTLIAPEQRTEIVERLAMMDAVSSEVVSQVMTLIKNRLQLRNQVDFSTTGGTKNIAEVLNVLDEATSNQILNSLEEKNPDVSRAIKKLLFTFEDLNDLDKSQMQRVLREVDFQILAKGLKTASEKLKALIFGALSKRAVESLQEELKFMPPVRLRDVEEAQDKIVEAVRRLESSGEITIIRKGGGGSDSIV